MKVITILFVLLTQVYASLEENLRNSLEEIITNAIEQVSVGVENSHAVTTRRNCSVSARVSCKVAKTGEDCEDLIVPIDECNREEMIFTFEYCNNSPGWVGVFEGMTNDVDMFSLPPGSMAYINAVPVDIDFRDLPPGKCWSVVETRKVNTCWKMINSSLKIEGWLGNRNVGDYCFAWDFYRRFIKRPQVPTPSTPCAVSSKISCVVDSTGQECAEYVVPYDSCGEESMSFTFSYCNDESDFIVELRAGDTSGIVDMSNLPTGTMAFIWTHPVEDINFNDLMPGKCRTITKSQKVNTCWGTIDASFKLEGWRGGGSTGDFCYAWEFYRATIRRPVSSCAVSSAVSCEITNTGLPCSQYFAPLDSCGRKEMTFTFKYCNNERRETIYFREGNTMGTIDMSILPPGTMAFIHKEYVEMNLKDLPPQRCRIVKEIRAVDTCWETIDASLKVEGWRGNGGDGDYCFAWDFYRIYIKRPSPSSCNVSAAVSCTVDRTGEKCDDQIVPLHECGEEDATFTFLFCNEDPEAAIRLRKGNTSGNVNMKALPPGSMAFIHTNPVDFDTSDLPPGKCRTIRETRAVNTCWETIDASLKVEGWRENGGDGDYCFAWDFYRNTIKRPDNTPAPTPSLSCTVRSEVSCRVRRTGFPCENLIVPLDKCGEEDATFTFLFCNEDPEAAIRLRKGNTSGNVNMKALPPGSMAFIHTNPVDFDTSDLLPGKCRTIRETRAVNTCWETIDASLKVEGWRENGGDGDYCFAWDFYRNTIKRPDNTPAPTPPSPTHNVKPCDISSKVSCHIDNTGDPCEDLVIPLSKCGREAMTFTFEYCSNEIYHTIELEEGDTSGDIDMKKLPPGTMAFTFTRPVALNLDDLLPGQCKTVVERRTINSCRPTIDASLKVEGWRGDGELGDFCFAWDFYRITIKRPPPSSSPILTPSPTTSFPSISMQPTVHLCGIPKDEQRARISAIIETVSSRADLQNPSSPQSRARRWILFTDTFDSFCPPPCNRGRKDGGVIQRYVMAVIYFATGGDENWKMCGRRSLRACNPQLTLFEGDPIDVISGNETWLEPVSECVWGGLSCRVDTECIDRIEFEGNDIAGELPREIGQLNLLRFLYLEGAEDSEQYFQGNMQLLQGTIPAEISTLTNLIILDLNFNTLSGEIPLGIYRMSNLRHLDVDHNNLIGSIPPDVAKLSNLRFLQLDNNLLTGTIPPEIGVATNLMSLLFHNNFFTGQMPFAICALLNTGLSTLSVDCEEVTCTCGCTCDGLA